MLLNFGHALAAQPAGVVGHQSADEVDHVAAQLNFGRKAQVLFVVLDLVIYFLVGLG